MNPTPILLVLSALAGPAAAQSGCGADPLLESVGLGTPGGAGIPELSTVGLPVPGGSLALEVTGGAPSAVGGLFFSPAEAPLPLPTFGATAYPGLPLFSLVFLLDGAGGSPPLLPQDPIAPVLCGKQLVFQAVVVDAAAQPLFASFRDGSALGAASSEVTREDTQVEVLNGAGVSGLAGRTRDQLSQLGYDVVGIGDADGNVSTTVIRHPEGRQANAELLQRDLPVSATLEQADVGTVTLVLGTDLSEGL